MARDAGFSIADVSVTIFEDTKVRLLVRRLQAQPGERNTALLLYLATVLESWKAGRQVAASEALPLWMEEDAVPAIEALVAAKLLDEAECVPDDTWEAWYGTARDRRARLRESGRKGGLARVASSGDAVSSAGKALSTAASKASSLNGNGRQRAVTGASHAVAMPEQGLRERLGSFADVVKSVTPQNTDLPDAERLSGGTSGTHH